jgi:TIR domain
MAQDYIYDVFISYRRKSPAGEWVRNHFYPLLQQWLPEWLDYEPQIFVDFDGIETGSTWPMDLSNALSSARYLVPIWNPTYFRSAWCMAELKTMMERERLLGLRSQSQPQGLIYPVVFADGDSFPEDVKSIQRRDFHQWNTPYLAFQKTEPFLEFDRAMQSLVQELAGLLQKVPPWQENWPILTPSVDPNVTFGLPRLQ